MKILSIIKENIYSIVLVFLVFAAIFSVKIIPFFIILLLILWFFKFKDFSNIKTRLIWVTPFFIYAGVVLISFFFSEDFKVSLKILERYLSFIILPVLIYFKKWTNKELGFFKFFFVRITIVISLFSILNLVYFYTTHVDFVKSMDETYLQWKLPHLSGFHPTYFGFIIVVANIILLKELIDQNPIKKVNFYIAISLSLYLLYLSPRTSMICLLVVWVNFIYHKMKNKNYSRIYYLIILSSTILLLVLTFLSSRYLMDKILKSLTDQRFLLWSESLRIIKENYFIVGEGLGDGKILIESYITKNELTQFKVADLHNQYLMNFIDMGFIGVLSLLYMLFRPVIFLKNRTVLIFSIVFSISILTESFLYVIKGIVIFIILYSFLIIDSQKNDSEKVYIKKT